MNKVKYLGPTSIHMTKAKVYDVVDYVEFNKKLIIKDDKGLYTTLYLKYKNVKELFEDVSLEYTRDKVITEILK